MLNYGLESNMDRLTASSIIEIVLRIGDELNKIDQLVRDITNEDERKALLTSLANVIIEFDASLIRPIVRKYPDLDPDA